MDKMQLDGEPEEFDKIPRSPQVMKPHLWNYNYRFSQREFIAIDGEGTQVNEPVEHIGNLYHWPGTTEVFARTDKRQAQPYVLLANSKGAHIIDERGLGTRDCFEFLLMEKQKYPNSIFVGFGFNYDVNQMLKDVSKKNLWKIHDRGKATLYSSYFIHWIPKKWLYIKHRPTQRSVKIYDVFGFFQTSFIQTCEKYLDKDDPELTLIRQGKAARESFTFDELESFILPYCQTELSMLVRVMNKLREDFVGVEIFPSEWYGPGAIANKVLAKYNVPISRDIAKEIGHASQYAYAGGRFEPFRVGRYEGTVWEYDIHSAYPAGATQIPDLTKGHWEYVRTFEPNSFGVWHLEYRTSHGITDNRPQPLFCRSWNGTISYPRHVEGWYWTPEASFCADNIREGFVFKPNSDTRPFVFIEELYDLRGILKLQGASTERAIKLILNSIYGKLAQTVGSTNGPPRWHQLEAAGYITSYTRAQIYAAIQLNPSAIIATETDAVFSTEPLALPLSEKLGDWEEKTYNEIVYLQSGFYYARQGESIICKYRGMDRDRNTGQPTGLPYNDVLQHLQRKTGRRIGRRTPALHSYTTRYIGLGLGLRTDSIWRSWEKKSHVVSLDQGQEQKRYHDSTTCPQCWKYRSMYDTMHPLDIGGYSGSSFARQLPWETGLEGADLSLDEFREMNPDYRDMGNDYSRFQ